VQLVEQDAARVEALLGERVAAERTVDRAGGGVLDGVLVDPQQAALLGVQIFGHLDRGLHLTKDDLGLVLVRGAGVDLGAGLVEDPVDREPRAQQ
jgi:hypothetical protein